jgi:hypothetical protein
VREGALVHAAAAAASESVVYSTTLSSLEKLKDGPRGGEAPVPVVRLRPDGVLRRGRHYLWLR